MLARERNLSESFFPVVVVVVVSSFERVGKNASSSGYFRIACDSEKLKKIKYELKERASVLEARLREKDEALRTREEELKEVKNELVKYAPTPLWKVLTYVQYRDIFEKHILWRLDELSFRVFRGVNTESRDAIRRAKRKVSNEFATCTR